MVTFKKQKEQEEPEEEAAPKQLKGGIAEGTDEGIVMMLLFLQTQHNEQMNAVREGNKIAIPVAQKAI